MTESPERERGQAPGLVESPDSVLGHPVLRKDEEEDPLLETEKNDEDAAVETVQALSRFLYGWC